MLNKKIASELAVGIVIIIALVIGGIVWVENKNSTINDQALVIENPQTQDFIKKDEKKDEVVCTQEAKLCEDGSYVGRTGPNCEFAECPKEKILYIEKHWATASPYKRDEQRKPTDEYSEILTIDSETKSKKLIYTDKDENFLIDSSREVRLISKEKILLVTKKRLYEGFEKPVYKIYDIKSGTLSDLQELPLPDKYIVFANSISMLPNGDFVYSGSDLNETENGIFICDKNFQNLRKIYTTQIFGNEGINSMVVSDDGKKIAFSIGQNGIVPGKLEQNVYVMNIDGSGLFKIFKKATYPDVFQWFSDSQRLVVGSAGVNFAITSLNGETIPLNEGSSVILSPDNSKKVLLEYETRGTEEIISKNGQLVRDGGYHMYVADLDDGNMEEIVTALNKDSLTLDIIGWIR